MGAAIVKGLTRKEERNLAMMVFKDYANDQRVVAVLQKVTLNQKGAKNIGIISGLYFAEGRALQLKNILVVQWSSTLEFAYRILLSKVTNKVSELWCRMWIESEFQQ